MSLKELIDSAEPTLAKRVEGFEDALGTLDAVLSNYGDYSLTLSCIALLNPDLEITAGCPIARFPGSATSLPLDCFHVDILHHSTAEGRTPEALRAIGAALALSWNRVLKENNLPGSFEYSENQGYDVEYRV